MLFSKTWRKNIHIPRVCINFCLLWIYIYSIYLLDECIYIWDIDLEKWELIGPYNVALDHAVPLEFTVDANHRSVLNILTVS